MHGSLRALAPVALTFLFLMGGMWWGFSLYLQHQANPNRDLRAGSGAPGPVVLRPDRQGHYFVPGQIDGKRVEFMLDTGASDVAVPAHLADRLGLRRGPRVRVETAGGTTRAYETRIGRVAVEGIRLRNIRGSINPAMTGSTVLLGMSFLRHVDFSQTGNRMILRAEP